MSEDFSFSAVEEAAELAYYSNERQQEALDFIYRWYDSDGSIFTAVDLIQYSENQNARFYSAVLLDKNIPYVWNSIQDMEKRFAIRDILYDQINKFTPDDSIHEILINAFVRIALFEWPENWVGFGNVVIPSLDNPESVVLNAFLILKTLVREIEDSDAITLGRKQYLRNTFSDSLDTIYPRIVYGLNNPSYAPHSLYILDAIIKWSPLEKLDDPVLIYRLSYEFIVEDSTREPALECLTSMFIIRTDSSSIFTKFSPIIISSLATATFSNGIPVTTSQHVIDFLLKFLQSYSNILELLFVEDKQDLLEISPYAIDSINNLTKTLDEMKISLEEFKQYLVHLYYSVASMPISSINDTFWQLWSDTFTRITIEEFSYAKIASAQGFFKEMLKNIRPLLYNALLSASNDEEQCSIFTRNCWVGLYRVDSQEMLDFLKAQTPSIQLCYAVGCLEFVFDPNSELLDIPSILSELLDYANTNEDENYLCALLFGISHSNRFFSTDNQLANIFFDLILRCLQGGERVADSASQALFYVIHSQTSIFIDSEENNYTSLLIEQSEFFLTQLDKNTAVRMYRICITLIYSHQDQEYQIQQTKQLFNPIVEILERISEVTHESLVTAFGIISECSYLHSRFVQLFYDELWPVLFNAAQIVIPDITISSELIEYLLSAIGALLIQSGKEEEEIKPSIVSLLEIIATRPVIEDYFFEFFGLVINSLSQYQEELYPTIRDSFILPVLQTDAPPLAGILTFLYCTNINLIDLEWYINLTLSGISNFAPDVNKAAAECTSHIVPYLFREKAELAENTKYYIASTLLAAITDAAHKLSFNRNVEVFYILIKHLRDYEQDQQIVCNSLIEILNQILPNEPQAGLFEQFVNYILSLNSLYDFQMAFVNFLVVLKKASPSDTGIFKIRPQQNFDFLTLVLNNSSFQKFINEEVKNQMSNEDKPGPIKILSIRVPMRMFLVDKAPEHSLDPPQTDTLTYDELPEPI